MTISNKTLSVICASIFLLGSGGIFLLANGSDQQLWLKLQAQNLSHILSGQAKVLGAFDGKNPLPAPLKLPILMYHHVGPLPPKSDALRDDLTVSPEDFELQVAFIKGQGFNTISLQNLLDYSQGQFVLPENPIVFTFDDGYEDAFLNAAPILKKYGFTGSFGVITQFPGISYGTNTYADWDVIKKAKDSGMEIVSHTQDHFDGTNEKYDDAFILRNLKDSKADLQENLGSSPAILIYPFGHFDKNYIKLADEAGFKMGLTTEFGKKIYFDELMEIPRVRIHGRQDFETFKQLVLE